MVAAALQHTKPMYFKNTPITSKPPYRFLLLLVGCVMVGSVMLLEVASGNHHRPLALQQKLTIFASIQTSILVIRILKIFFHYSLCYR